MNHINDVLGYTAALSAAVSTGLLAQLIEGAPRTPAELAAAANTSPRATALVLDVLVAYELALREGERVTAAPALRAIGDAPGGIHRALAMWGYTGQFLKTGDPFIRMDAAREETYSQVVIGLGKLFAASAKHLVERIGITPRNVLDIGCGSGVWGLSFAEAHPAARVTGQDLPAVLESFRAFAQERGLADRIATIPGDIHQTTLPRAFDLVIVANVLRIEAPERAREIVRRAAGALEPNGALVIVDALAGGTPVREQARAVYALHLGMRTDHGRVYSRDEITGWIAACGLTRFEHFDAELEVMPGALGAIVAR